MVTHHKLSENVKDESSSYKRYSKRIVLLRKMILTTKDFLYFILFGNAAQTNLKLIGEMLVLVLNFLIFLQTRREQTPSTNNHELSVRFIPSTNTLRP